MSAAQVAGRRLFRPSRLITYTLLLVVAVFYLLPIYVIVVTAFKSFVEVSHTTPWQLPSAPSLDSFGNAFTTLAPSFYNSVLLVVPATILSALLGSLNGYVL